MPDNMLGEPGYYPGFQLISGYVHLKMNTKERYQPMKPYAEHALEILKDKGLRITKPRRLVLELLELADKPMSAYEIKDLIAAQDEKIDTVSVYRILDCLEENHLIHRVLATGKVRKCSLEHEEHCHLPQEDHCHHLLICEKCQATEEVHCPGTAELVRELERLSHFKIRTHNMEFLGLCARCCRG
jgi:Fe2+ or Zn2+ uptake regulation protein